MRGAITVAPSSIPAARLQGEIDFYADNGPQDCILYGTQPVAITGPRHNERDLSILLASLGCSLPKELAGHLPKAEELPEDAVA